MLRATSVGLCLWGGITCVAMGEEIYGRGDEYYMRTNSPESESFPNLKNDQWYFGAPDGKNCVPCLDWETVWPMVKGVEDYWKTKEADAVVLMVEPEVTVPTSGEAGCFAHGHADLDACPPIAFVAASSYRDRHPLIEDGGATPSESELIEQYHYEGKMGQPFGMELLVLDSEDPAAKRESSRYSASLKGAVEKRTVPAGFSLHHDLEMLGILAALDGGEGGIRGVAPGVPVKLAFLNDWHQDSESRVTYQSPSGAVERFESGRPRVSESLDFPERLLEEARREIEPPRGVEDIESGANPYWALHELLTNGEGAPIVSIAQQADVGERTNEVAQYVKVLHATNIATLAGSKGIFEAYADGRRGKARGTLFVLSAGNNAKHNEAPISAAQLVTFEKPPNMLIVGAIQDIGEKAEYSDFSIPDLAPNELPRQVAKDLYVDLYAPSSSDGDGGVCNDSLRRRVQRATRELPNIPLPTNSVEDTAVVTTSYSYENCNQDNPGVPGYDAINGGSSAAATIVSGIASLVHQVNPELSAEEIREILLGSTEGFATPVVLPDSSEIEIYESIFIRPEIAVATAIDYVVLQWAEFWEDFISKPTLVNANWIDEHFGYYSNPSFNYLVRTNRTNKNRCYISAKSRKYDLGSIQIPGACSVVDTLQNYGKRLVSLQNQYESAVIDIYSPIQYEPVLKVGDRKEGKAWGSVEIVKPFDGSQLNVRFIQRFKGIGSDSSTIYCDVVEKELKLALLSGRIDAAKSDHSDSGTEGHWWYVSEELGRPLGENHEISCS